MICVNKLLAPAVLAAFAALCGCTEPKYPSGRDTRDSFGDGRFQIGVYPDPIALALDDAERGEVVVDRVKNWRATSGHVFVVNEDDKCWKVNYRTGEILSFEIADAAPADDREVFENLLKKKPMSKDYLGESWLK